MGWLAGEDGAAHLESLSHVVRRAWPVAALAVVVQISKTCNGGD